MILKEMEYKSNWNRKATILAIGSYEGYLYLVTSVGPHPCAYVAIEEGQPYYNDIFEYSWATPVNCHGGPTYLEHGGPIVFDSSYRVVGWDYGHYDDYSGIYEAAVIDDGLRRIQVEGKKWTTKEIVEECKQVINQLYFVEHPEIIYE